MVFPILFAIFPYWMIGFPSTAVHFMLFIVTFMIASFAGSSYGYMLAVMANDFDTGIAVMTVLTIPQLLFCGFLMKIDNVLKGLQWLKYISVFYYGFDAMAIIIWKDQDFDELSSPLSAGRGDDSDMPAPRNGNEVLDGMQIYGTLGQQIACLLVLSLVFRIIGLVVVTMKFWRQPSIPAS
eukprot:gene8884-10528_t